MLRFIGLLLLLALPAQASTSWEVAVLFLGSQEAPEYQADIDENILELARVIPGDSLRISLLREFSDRRVTYFPDPKSTRLNSWDPLFHRVPAPGIQVPGEMHAAPLSGKSILDDETALRRFFASAFRKTGSQRLLLIYAHGEGHEGLRLKPLVPFVQSIQSSLPARNGQPLDLLWLNSCFMASVEAVWELAPISRWVLASQDAEFSAGAPFDVLNAIENKSPSEAGQILGFRYLESYSFLKKGSQRRSVFESAATISLVDTKSLLKLGPKLKRAAAQAKSASSAIEKKIRRAGMAKDGLVDLGHTAHSIGATDLSLTLETNAAGKRHTSPRIYIPVPTPGARLVFGYENWTRGFRGDEESLEKLPVTRQGFYQRGPKGKDWPFRTGERRHQLAPFSPGLNLFNFFFAAPSSDKAISGESFFQRTRDVFTFQAEAPENPVVFSGHTEGKGAAGERYTGLNVWDPTQSTPSTDYLDLKFFQATGWSAR